MTVSEIIESCVSFSIGSPATQDTAVFGDNSSLDSIGLVSLLADIEQKIYDEFRKEITIASEKAMSRSRSPFRSVATLTEFVEELIS